MLPSRYPLSRKALRWCPAAPRGKIRGRKEEYQQLLSKPREGTDFLRPASLRAQAPRLVRVGFGCGGWMETVLWKTQAALSILQELGSRPRSEEQAKPTERLWQCRGRRRGAARTPTSQQAPWRDRIGRKC